MKKLMLACTAALFSIVALAQETQQDSTRTETDQYRQERQQQTEQNMDTTSVDSVSNEFREAAEQIENEGEKELDTLQQDATEMRDTLVEQGNDVGNELKNEAREMRDSARQDTEQAIQPMQNDPQTEKAATDQGASTMSSENSGENSTPSELEVVEGKEGPNNEVVYKFKGEMWYVDRESKQMVKADESKLKDSKHKVMVHEGSSTNAKSKNNKKGKS